MAAFAEKCAAQGGAGHRRVELHQRQHARCCRRSSATRPAAMPPALAFARRELFDKLGMQHVTLEFDAVGTPIGSSHMLASARDWARFGLLYLNDGVVGGERLLPRGLGRLLRDPDAGQRGASAMPPASGPTAATATAHAIASPAASRPMPSWRAAPTGNTSSSCPRSGWSSPASAPRSTERERHGRRCPPRGRRDRGDARLFVRRLAGRTDRRFPVLRPRRTCSKIAA